MRRLTILRHGESIWNRDKRFTGWADVELSPRGTEQARRACLLLKAKGFRFDACFTSCLTRASATARIVLDAMGLGDLRPVESWRLNERHYGALEGMSHIEARRVWGTRQVFAWQRQFAAPPPPLAPDDHRHPRNDARYSAVPPEQLPGGESLSDTLDRVLPLWTDAVTPEIRAGNEVLIVAHGNTLRVLLKYLGDVAEKDVPTLHVPICEPLVYELDEAARPLGRYYLRWRPRLLDRAARISQRRGKAS
jgi:2,3-bisphosphoglycerate-dependent phosphoglycerate mutase